MRWRWCLLGLVLAAPAAAQTSTPGNYIDRWTLSTTATFIGRIQIASASTARTVLEEATTVPKHETRFALAQRVLNEPQFLAIRLAPMIAASVPVTSTDHDNNPATPPVVDTTWSDEQIQTLMTQQWNLFASAFVPAAAPPLTLAAPPVPPVKR
jgi:hypothetical protein